MAAASAASAAGSAEESVGRRRARMVVVLSQEASEWRVMHSTRVPRWRAEARTHGPEEAQARGVTCSAAGRGHRAARLMLLACPSRLHHPPLPAMSRSAILYDTQLTITAIDPDGKKFDRGASLLCASSLASHSRPRLASLAHRRVLANRLDAHPARCRRRHLPAHSGTEPQLQAGRLACARRTGGRCARGVAERRAESGGRGGICHVRQGECRLRVDVPCYRASRAAEGSRPSRKLSL